MTISVLEYLERSAAAVPEKPAVVAADGSSSYAQLLERCRRVGSGLLPFCRRGTPTAVLMEKGLDALTAFFGIVYAGSFYCLLNPELPDARLAGVQSVLKAGTVIVTADLQERAAGLFPDCKILCITDLLHSTVDEAGLEAVRRCHIDTDPLYVNFTSGSTGTPKGIVVGHRSVLDFIGCFTPLFGIGQEDVIANQAPFDFDVSVKDIYSAMRTGATLVIVPRALFSAPAALIDFLCEHRITTMIWAVSALCLISTFHALDYKTPETVNKILFSGEVMPAKHLKTWRSHLPNALFVNLYGPTEITCNCTYHILDAACDYAGGIPIGIPFPNEDVFLLNEQDGRVKVPETVGELCVRGSALALGYYCLPAERPSGFVRNPLNPNYHEWIYRTGDLAKYREDGLLVFCGRKDFQVKYMGHRVELEEVERALAAIPGIERCCCLFDEAKGKLMAFYIGELDKHTLHAEMMRTLPAFMVPNLFRRLEEMPLTKNGKIDRKALMESVTKKHGVR